MANLNIASKLICDSSCLPLCQSSIAVLSSSPTKSLEDCKRDVYALLLGKLLSYTSPYPMHHILTHRSTSCANAPVHGCVQMHKMHTSASTLCLSPIPSCYVSSVLALTEIVYLPTCQPHEIFTSLIEHTPLHRTSLSQ